MRFFKFPIEALERGLVVTPEEVALFVQILKGAHHSDCWLDRQGERVWVRAGEFLTSVRQLEELSGWSFERVRRWLTRSGGNGLLVVRPIEKRNGTILSVRHWWQLDEAESPTESPTRSPVKSPTESPTRSQNKNLRTLELENFRERETLTLAPCEPVKEPKRSKSKTKSEAKPQEPLVTYGGESSPVCMTERQYRAEVDRYGESTVVEYIEIVRDYCLANKVRYDDYAATIRNFVRRDRKKNEVTGKVTGVVTPRPFSNHLNDSQAVLDSWAERKTREQQQEKHQ